MPQQPVTGSGSARRTTATKTRPISDEGVVDALPPAIAYRPAPARDAAIASRAAVQAVRPPPGSFDSADATTRLAQAPSSSPLPAAAPPPALRWPAMARSAAQPGCQPTRATRNGGAGTKRRAAAHELSDALREIRRRPPQRLRGAHHSYDSLASSTGWRSARSNSPPRPAALPPPASASSLSASLGSRIAERARSVRERHQ